MTQISFYALSTDSEESRRQFACRLAEKAFSMGHQVFIQVQSIAEAKEIDDLLWSFRPNSFVPHSSDHEPKVAVQIGVEAEANQHDEVLINLTNSPCTQHRNFQRINEILTTDEASLKQGRNCYRFYQTAGYKPETHKI
ncbi:MAG TPA: DNA polymerase III subunit chi [Porticoccaceae bacterium]|jgi:DNA polymerase III subunit chi|nr:DNA polymerase III subunit chi [Gammaproteobacteria bacterium]HIL59285.1 DNA polymerase III subunit chi [Porticoccaceae bacterium]